MTYAAVPALGEVICNSKSPVTDCERVSALRLKRKEMGLARLEVWAHLDDHEEIKALAHELQRQRLGATLTEINYSDPIDYSSSLAPGQRPDATQEPRPPSSYPATV
jgi:hypothetical protein